MQHFTQFKETQPNYENWATLTKTKNDDDTDNFVWHKWFVR